MAAMFGWLSEASACASRSKRAMRSASRARPSGRALIATARERFRREAHVLSRLSHPGVATIFDFATQDDIDFLVMEYVPGGTLEAHLKEGPLPLDDVYRLGAEIGDALADAHTKGFLHR